MRTDMRHLINIKQINATQNDYGEQSSWSVLFSNIFAAKEPLIGRELYQAESVNSNVNIKFRTHYLAGVENDMRVEHEGSDYDIISAVNVKGYDRELLMYCRKVVQ